MVNATPFSRIIWILFISPSSSGVCDSAGSGKEAAFIEFHVLDGFYIFYSEEIPMFLKVMLKRVIRGGRFWLRVSSSELLARAHIINLGKFHFMVTLISFKAMFSGS